MIDRSGRTVSPPRGASDAFLAPHVERSKIFVHERFGDHPFVDSDRICGAIELMRFPVPEDPTPETDSEAGLLRAADLIGQLGDPFYARKLNALFSEFEEIGCNERLGYETPADLADQYPGFFWSKVEPFIGSAVGYLQLTVEGRQWIANLYCNVFEVEHTRRSMGPQRSASAGGGSGSEPLARWSAAAVTSVMSPRRLYDAPHTAKALQPCCSPIVARTAPQCHGGWCGGPDDGDEFTIAPDSRYPSPISCMGSAKAMC